MSTFNMYKRPTQGRVNKRELKRRFKNKPGNRNAEKIIERLSDQSFCGMTNLRYPIETAAKLLLHGYWVHIYRKCCDTMVLKDLNYCNCHKPHKYELYVCIDPIQIIKNCHFLYKRNYEQYEQNNYLDIVLTTI